MSTVRTSARVAIALLAVVGLLAAMGPASGHGGPAETFTVTFKDVTETFPDVNPCTGEPATIFVTEENGVLHMTQHPDGHFHLTGTFTGRFTLVPEDPSEPTYTGRFTIWFGENHNERMSNATFTFSAHGKGSDGSALKFSTVAHITAATIDFSTDPPTITDVKVEFEKARCH